MKKLINELGIMKTNLENLQTISISDLDLSKTDLFIIDMNNGFAKEGALYSPRIEALINPIYKFVNSISEMVHSIIAFTDCHEKDCLEFESYPPHCLNGDVECEIVDELKLINNIKIIKKNSTNGFFALDNTSFDEVENIIIVGDCTDICIYQFATTLNSYFIHNNIKKNIIVPINLVDTYDIGGIHPAHLLNLVFFNSMIQNGIKVVKEIKL
jgi:nicotinamidase-related amidase